MKKKGYTQILKGKLQNELAQNKIRRKQWKNKSHTVILFDAIELEKENKRNKAQKKRTQWHACFKWEVPV